MTPTTLLLQEIYWMQKYLNKCNIRQTDNYDLGIKIYRF